MNQDRQLQDEFGDYVVLAAIALLLVIEVTNIFLLVFAVIRNDYPMTGFHALIVLVCAWGIRKMLWAMEYVRKLREK
jgi:hypothetical protein